MDFRQTLQSSGRPAGAPTPSSSSTGGDAPKRVRSGGGNDFWFRLLNIVILIGIAILVAAVALTFTRTSSNSEFKLVQNDKYQAVFLNNGQVYFGNIKEMDSKNLVLSNIYYLTQNTTTGSDGQQTADGNYTLVKLGCQQIHDPYDQMVINRDQVTFWENLQDKGSVVSKINEFKKSYPNGPDCSQQPSSQTQATSNSNTQNATNPNNKQ